MGSVFQRSSVTTSFFAENVLPGWQFRLIENGQCVYTETIENAPFAHRAVLERTKPISFQRVELWDETGRCILLTNPIYLSDATFADKISAERMAQEGSQQ